MRTTKPEYWADEDLADLSRDARLLYIGLWNLADEHARLRGRADYIKGQLLPYDEDLPPVAVDKLLDELANAGKVIRYTVENRSYLFLPNLSKHQRLEPEKVPSRLPPPPDATLSESRADEPAPNQNGSEPHAKDHALKQVAGSRLQVAGSRGQGSAAPPGADAAFDRFWAAYPRHEAKDKARKAWEKLIKDKRTDPDVIIAGAARYRDDPGRDPQFTAHPASWLNAGRWTDDPLPLAGQARASPGVYRNPTDPNAYTEGL